jgi:nucleotidyltransferase/DNA polymerase involved in DNA repair
MSLYGLCDQANLEYPYSITNYCNEHGLNAEDCVQEIRAKVQEETKLTVSAGIAANKAR